MSRETRAGYPTLRRDAPALQDARLKTWLQRLLDRLPIANPSERAKIVYISAVFTADSAAITDDDMRQPLVCILQRTFRPRDASRLEQRIERGIEITAAKWLTTHPDDTLARTIREGKTLLPVQTHAAFVFNLSSEISPASGQSIGATRQVG